VLSLQLLSKKFKITKQGIEELAPTVGSQPLPRWARGPLSIPYRLGTPTYKLQVKTRCGACTHMLPCVLRHQTLPPNQGGLRGCHVSRGSRTRFPDEKGSGATTCTVAPDPLGGLRCATCPVAPHPASLPGGLRAATCPIVSCGLWVTSIKKRLAGLTVQLGPHVPNARTYVSKTPDVRAILACKTCSQAV
jgi:hypothetical protein